MQENIVFIYFTLFYIICFAISYLIEKSRCKSIEDKEQVEKELKKAKNILYIWTDISLVWTILILLFDGCVEWHVLLIILYGLLEFILSLVKLITKNISIKLFFNKLILNPIILFGILFQILCIFASDLQDNTAQMMDKPVIYIYPETETTVQVSVGYPEKLSCVYPEYDIEEGWEVIAKPNGDLVDTKTGRNLYCLYWEGNQKQEYKFKDGFVVAGKDSAKFLEEKLAILGLNEREANEFIIYWLPKLEANKYNLIRFETMEEIEEYMPLNVEPKPDTLIRIVMDFKGLNRPVEIPEQKLEPVTREGYTVVEWGGSEF